jgi:acyl carrier protein
MLHHQNNFKNIVLSEGDVRNVISEVIPTVDISTLKIDSEFEESNLDSLDHWAVLLALQERFGLVVPDEDLNQTTSIGKILSYAAKRTD